MKVKEYLYEKFTEESDAINDMGIGIEKLIRDFMRNDIEEYQDDEDPETKNKDTILGYSVIYEKEDFVDYLISKGANINNKSVNNWFKFACKYDHIAPIKLLIKKDFNFHGSPGEGHEKGLRIAIANDHLEVVKILIEAGADPEVVDGKPVRIAIANNNMPILKYLKEKGVKIAKWEYFKLANEYKVRAMTDFIGQEIKAEKKRKIRKFFRLKESLYEKFEEESDPISDMGIGKIDIHKYIRELVAEDDNTNRVYEFLSSLINKKIMGNFQRFNEGWIEGGISNYTFMITRYSLDEKKETLRFEDDNGFTYLVMWGEKYHIS